MNLEKYQANVLVAVLDIFDIDGDVETLEFSLSGEFHGKFKAAYFALKSGDGHIVFTLPTYTRSVFFCVAYDNPKRAALYLANIEDYERENSVNLNFGDVIMFPIDGAADAAAPFSVILLRTATSVDCSGLPDNLKIDDGETALFLAVPLSAQEHRIRNTYGHDALMDAFEDSGKDIFFD